MARLRLLAGRALPGFGFLVLGAALLAGSIRPGRTLVPADVLTVFTPYRVLAGGVQVANGILSDAAIQFFPWLHVFGEGLREHGRLPSWNPTLLGGVPMVPSGFVAPDYPGFWLTRVLSPFDAYDLFVLGHLVLAALGVYWFARVLGARRSSAWLAGSLALLAGPWLHWSTHLVHLVGMAWLPWALAAAHRLADAPDRRRGAALALVVGLWWLGGNPQYAFFGSLALGGYCTILVGLNARGRRGSPARAARSAAALVGAVGLGFVLAAPTLLPTAASHDWILRRREPPSSIAETSLPPNELARLVVPDATGNTADEVRYGSLDEYRMDSPFIGVTGILLCFAALAVPDRRKRAVPLAVCGGAALLLAFTGAPHRLLYDAVPLYDRFRGAARWTAVLPAFALPLAALGLDALLDRDRAARRWVFAAAVGSLALTAWFWLRQRDDLSAPHDYLTVRAWIAVGLVGAVALATWAATRRRDVAAGAFAVVIAFELVWAVPRWHPDVVESDAYPEVAVARIAAERGGRLVRVGLVRSFVSTFSADVPGVYGASDAQGQAVLFPRDYDRFLRLIDDHGNFARDTNVAPDLRATTDLRSRLLDVLDVRTVVAESNVPVVGAERILDQTEPWVYSRSGGRPAMLVPRADPAPDDESMWAAVERPSWDPAGTASVRDLERPVRGGTGDVRLVSSTGDRERWAVEAPQGGFLRVSGNWADGWRAEVDGRGTPVLRADGPFRGVVVPPGARTVTFSYADPRQRTGRWLAGVGALAVVALVVPAAALRRRGPRRAGDT